MAGAAARLARRTRLLRGEVRRARRSPLLLRLDRRAARAARDDGAWQWAGTLSVLEARQRRRRHARVRLPRRAGEFADAVVRRPESGRSLARHSLLHAPDGVRRCGSSRCRGVPARLPTASSRFDIAPGTTECGVLLRASDDGDEGYVIRLEPRRGRLVFDRWPRRRTGDGAVADLGRRAVRRRARAPLRHRARRAPLEVVVDGDLCVGERSTTGPSSAPGSTTAPHGRLGVFVGEGAVVVNGVLRLLASPIGEPAASAGRRTRHHNTVSPRHHPTNTTCRHNQWRLPHMNITSAHRGARRRTLAPPSSCSGLRGLVQRHRPDDVDPEGEITPREISWLLSRPADGGVITAMQQIADEYAEDHPGFALNLITTPDRPSYIQKYETLAAANKLPELFDTDATPVRAEARRPGTDDRRRRSCCEDLGLHDDYRRRGAELPALRRRLAVHGARSSSSWSSSGTTRRCSSRPASTVPATLDDFAGDVRGAARGGHHPDRPRRTGPVAARALHGLLPVPHSPVPNTSRSSRTATRRSGTSPGAAAAEWLYSLGKAGCFQEGFSSTGYADAQALFTSGKAADVQHRHVGARQPRNRRARRRRARLGRLLHPADDRRRRHGRQRVRHPVGHRHGRQRADVRPARARLPRIRSRALPRGVRRDGRAVADHGVETGDPGQRDPAVPRAVEQAERCRAERSRCRGTRSSTPPRTRACSRS